MVLRQGIRAVTFDVGGTLITPWPSVGHVYAEIAARHGYISLSPEILTRRFAAAWKALDNFEHTRPQWAALVDSTFRGLIETPPSQTFFPALYDRFSEAEAWHVFADVHPSLNGLRARGLKLGVISNWDDRLRPLLKRLGLQSYFHAIVVSCEVGFPKPSRRIFQRAVGDLGLPPAAVLHIGDNLEMDVSGAKAAGLKASLLDRCATARSPGILQSLAEL